MKRGPILLAGAALALTLAGTAFGRPCDIDGCTRSSAATAQPTAQPTASSQDNYPGAPPSASVIPDANYTDTYPGKPPADDGLINTLPLNITGGAVFIQIVVEQYPDKYYVYSINRFEIEGLSKEGFTVVRSDGLEIVRCTFFKDAAGALQVAAPPGWKVTYR